MLIQLLVVSVVFIFCIGCDIKEIAPESGIVAHVGEHAITAREFKLNYEFGFAHLKNSPDKKFSYLGYMINETLLSIEGYRLGLDKTERVQRLEQTLLEELLVEELFRIEVDEKIQVTPEKVKQAINKSKVRWKLRYWVVPDLDIEEYIYQSMQDQGYENVVQNIQTNNPEATYHLKNFETDYLTWLDVHPELLEVIENLQITEISKPIELNEVYYLFQVTDIQRGGISDYDYQNTYKRFEQIIFYRQQEEKTASYISDFITPKDIITKGNALRTLAIGLAAWKQKSNNKGTFSEALENAIETESALWKLKNQLEDTLITFDRGRLLIKDIVSLFDPAAITADPSAKDLFHNQFKQQIALTIRNHLLAKEAIAHGLHKSLAVENQLQSWRDKWVYEEMRRFYTKSITIDDFGIKDFFRNNKSRYRTRNGIEPVFTDFANQARQSAYFEQTHLLLEKKIQLLKKVHKVQIYKAVLDTVSVTNFEKSRWANLVLFKNSTGKMAIPIIDPAWGFGNISQMHN